MLEYQFLLKYNTFFIAYISRLLPLSETQLEKYEPILFWECVAGNQDITWTAALIEKHKAQLFEEYSSINFNSNEVLPFSISFVQQFYEHWTWQLLAQNRAFTSNPEFLQHFAEELAPYSEYLRERESNIPIGGNCLETHISSISEIEKLSDPSSPWLSSNTNLPWSYELIKKYESNWDWEGLSLNNSIPWDARMLTEFGHHLPPEFISISESVQWSIDLLWQFEHLWDTDVLSLNETAWRKVFLAYKNPKNYEPILDQLLVASQN